jgi:hypothetical protein
MISVSRPVRLAFKDQLAMEFNSRVEQACLTFGVEPFTIDFDPPGAGELPTFYDGPFNLDLYLKHLEESHAAVPAMSLYDEGIQQKGYTQPVPFSGIIALGGHVFLKFALGTVDFESLAEAVETAIVGMVHESETDNWAGATYRDDIKVRTGDLVYSEDGAFYRTVQFQLSFQI